MTITSTVEVHDGRPVLVRTGAGHEADALRDEAAVLDALAGPGVPTVVSVDEDGDRFRLVISLAPPLPLQGAAEATVAGAFAAAAAVLARAHARGVIHGALEASDLRVDGSEVVVAGWGRGLTAATAADDVAALGRLLDGLAPTAALRNIAARAAATEPDARPTMAALEVTLRDLHRSRHRRAVPRSGIVVGTLVVLVVVVVGGAAMSVLHRPGGALATVPPAATTTSSSTTSTTAAPAPRLPSGVTVDGNVVERGGERWTVGRPGDVVVVGAWRCDGKVTAAVLRPSIGRIWMFAEWPRDSTPVAGRALATVPGAVTARVRAVGRCDRLDVLDAKGQTTSVA